MKRLIQTLLRGVVGLSLTLFIAILVIWVRSYSVSDGWLRTLDGSLTMQRIEIQRGRMIFFAAVDDIDPWPESVFWPTQFKHDAIGSNDWSVLNLADELPTPTRWMGFAYQPESEVHIGFGATVKLRFVVIPLWCPALLTLLAPLRYIFWMIVRGRPVEGVARQLAAA